MAFTDTTNRQAYTCNGVTVAFAYSHPFNVQADLVVLKVLISDGTETTLALTTDYTISGTTDAYGAYPDGATVTTVATISSLYRLIIYRDPARTQGVTHVENDPLPVISGVEHPLNKLTMLIQRVHELITRSLRQPDGDSAAIAALPAKVVRASLYAGYDADGDPVALAAPANTTAVTAAAATILDDTTVTAIRQTLLLDKHGADIASAATLDLDVATGDLVDVTGTTTITAITLAEGVEKTIRFTGALTFTHGASLVLPGAANITTVAGDFAVVRGYASGVVRCVQYLRAASALDGAVGTLPRVASGPAIAYGAPAGHLHGLTLSNNGSDATNDIDIAIGEAASNGSTYASRVVMSLTSALTKQLDATWVAGTNQGGRTSSVAIANGTWHVFLMRVAGADDIGFDTSVTGANLTTDHGATHLRRIGSIVRASAAILGFSQQGDQFLLKTGVLDYASTAINTTSALVTLASIPTGLKFLAHIRWSFDGAAVNSAIYISSPDVTDENPSDTVAPLQNVVNSSTIKMAGELYVRLNTSAQFRIDGTDASGDLDVVSVGWFDERGRQY